MGRLPSPVCRTVAVGLLCLNHSVPAVYQGQPALTGYPEVVAVDGECTGVLMEPPMALTAAHCVTSGGKISQTVSLYSRQWNKMGKLERIQADVIATDTDYDVAALCLTSVPSTSVVATVSPRAPVTQEIVEVVGWGASVPELPSDLWLVPQAWADGAPLKNSLPKKGHSRVSDVAATNFRTHVNQPKALSTACAGDSGGPAYEDQSKRLFGLAIVLADVDKCGEPVIYTRLDTSDASAWLDAARGTMDGHGRCVQ